MEVLIYYYDNSIFMIEFNLVAILIIAIYGILRQPANTHDIRSKEVAQPFNVTA